MVDLPTLMISLMIVEGLLAFLMVLIAHIQTNYPGFSIWTFSLVTLAASMLFLLLRGVVPEVISVVIGNLLLLFSLLLMAESLHRFFTDRPMTRWPYLVLVPVGLLILWFTVVDNTITIRSGIISLTSILLILLIVRVIRTCAPKGNLPSRYLTAALLCLAAVMGVRGCEWFISPGNRDFFEQTTINAGLYVMAIITLLTITFMFLLLHVHRLSSSLQEAHAQTARLLEDLDEKNRELDQKVQERTQKINHLLMQKDQFITQIAHDLRTPLTPLIALVPLIKLEIEGDEGERLFSLMEKNVKNLQYMAEQLIKLAGLNSQASIVDYHERDLASLIQEAVMVNSGLIEEREIKVEMVFPPSMRVCVSKVFGVTIFSNVINNAVKYNVRQGRIIISAREEDTMIAVSIADTGVGMQEETLEQIWDELYINDLSRSDPASKGLGLSMVRKIVALHGGDITAASPGVGKGSVFIIRLPRFCVDNCEKSGTDI